jgi:hypothetical protein
MERIKREKSNNGGFNKEYKGYKWRGKSMKNT